MIKNNTLPYAGAGVSFCSGIFSYFSQLNWGDLASIAGILFAILTYLTSWYYRAKQDRREEKLLQERLRQEKIKNEK